MKNISLLILFLSLLLTSCGIVDGKKIRGNGNITTQVKRATNFHDVDVSGAIEVVVAQDSAFAVKVETDENLQEYIEVYERDGVLHIHNRDHYDPDPTKSTIVYVNAPTFGKLEASGACSIKSGNRLSSAEGIWVDMSGASHSQLDVKAPSVHVDLSGACSATLQGETRDLQIDGSGSTTVDAFGLLAENTEVQLSGAGNADVYASKSLSYTSIYSC